jgi:hypothetical protein
VALFVDRQHDGMARRVHVEADNILDLLGEGGVVPNNPSPLDVLVRAVAIADDSRQARSILGSNDHANILCHVSKIAWPATPVNPSFVSQH